MNCIENNEDLNLTTNQESKQTIVIYDSDDGEINWQDNTDSDYVETDSEDVESSFEEADHESDFSFESNNEEVPEIIVGKEDYGEWKCSGNFKTLVFKGDAGFKCSSIGNEPYHFFELLFDTNFFSTIVQETNNYGRRRKGDQWKLLTVPEFKIFLGLLLHTGTIKCSQMQNYWSVTRLFTLTCFTQHMSRNRFQEILLCLHFSSNERDNNHLNKIRPVINYFNDKMKQVYYPHKEISVDQIVVPWLGSLVFRPNIPGKRRKFGIKLYVLSESSGISLRIKVYKGGSSCFNDKGYPTKVVLHLLEDFLQKGHSVYLNNCCTSVELATQLLGARTYCTGMLRKSKKVNKNFVNAKLSKGTAISCHRNNIMMGKFRNKSYYLFISSEFKADFVELKNKKKVNYRMPLALHKYNAFMNAIKNKDELLSSHTCLRRTFKWYIKLWLYVVETLLLNSFFLYSKYSTATKKISFSNFRLNIIDALLFTNRIQASMSSTSLKIEHKPETLPRDENNRVKRKRCRQCYSNGTRKKTNFFCRGCLDNPGLCYGECFRKYHKRFE